MMMTMFLIGGISCGIILSVSGLLFAVMDYDKGEKKKAHKSLVSSAVALFATFLFVWQLVNL